MWRNVRVLLWKNWRVKQRESRFNQGRSSKRWLFPALVTDIVIPLGLLLLLIQKLCEYNAQLATPGGSLVDFEGMRHALDHDDHDAVQAERAMTTFDDNITEDFSQVTTNQVKNEPATLLLAALPLLLGKSNQSLAILERKDTQLFLQYLDR